MTIEFNPQKLQSPLFRAKHGYLVAHEIRETYGYTVNVFDKLVRAGRIPPPCFTINCRNMRVWHKDRLVNMPEWTACRKRREFNKELTPCIQMSEETRRVLIDTRKLFAIMKCL